MRSSLANSLGLLTILCVAGCNNAPRGDEAGRISPNESTKLDQRSPEANAVYLQELANEVAQRMASGIATISDITGSPTKVAIELGRIDNRTRTPSSDFEIVRRRVFIAMQQSDYINRFCTVYESPEAMDAEYARLAPQGAPDRLDEGRGGGGGTQRNRPDLVYVLNGWFGETVRGGGLQSDYYFELTLTNLATRKRVFASQKIEKQLR